MSLFLVGERHRLCKINNIQIEDEMEEAAKTFLNHELIMLLMGYAIAIAYLFIAISKKEIKYLREENKRAIQRIEEKFGCRS